MFNLTKLALLWDWVNLLKKDSAEVHGDIAAIEAKLPKDYSTTETATGQKWIDGRDIYQKVFAVEDLQIGTAWAIVGEINADFVLDIFCCNSDGVYSNYYLGRINEGNLEIYSGRSANTTVNFVSVKYLKPTTPGRAPEDQEPEPEEKKTTKKKTSK